MSQLISYYISRAQFHYFLWSLVRIAAFHIPISIGQLIYRFIGSSSHWRFSFCCRSLTSCISICRQSFEALLGWARAFERAVYWRTGQGFQEPRNEMRTELRRKNCVRLMECCLPMVKGSSVNEHMADEGLDLFLNGATSKERCDAICNGSSIVGVRNDEPC